MRFPRFFRRRVAGATPLGMFLVATLALAGWLGYQAVDAAASHRRTAEAVLSKFALVSAQELARVARGSLGDVLDDVFDPVSPGRMRWRGNPRAEELQREMTRAMREERCACPGFRSPLALFHVYPATGEVHVVSESLTPKLMDAVVASVLARTPTRSRTLGLLTVSAEEVPAGAVAVGYALVSDDDVVEAALGFVISLDALGELFGAWYDDQQLLPEAIAGGQPNDSLLHVTVQDAVGRAVFASTGGYPSSLGASAALDDRLGGLTIHATVRPDAASQLIIGGLPRSRLPLLAMLLLLTLGVGIAAVVQLRREQAFQRLRDDFVSGVSHELRTPLAQIRMFSELQQAGKLPSDEDRQRATQVIHRESRRLSHLVENILQFSRLRRSPEQRMPRERLDLAEALADGVDAVTPLLEDRGMRLDLSAEHDLAVVANREALTRIVVNLLDNAVKYGPRGQRVRVGIERVNGSARLSVADQGPGVPSGDRDRVWKAYRRLERDVRAQVPGTGIGLSVVAELAVQHRGRAWVEQGEGGGARFVVELPLAPDRSGDSPGEVEA